jgi:hypothetical protein
MPIEVPGNDRGTDEAAQQSQGEVAKRVLVGRSLREVRGEGHVLEQLRDDRHGGAETDAQGHACESGRVVRPAKGDERSREQHPVPEMVDVVPPLDPVV